MKIAVKNLQTGRPISPRISRLLRDAVKKTLGPRKCRQAGEVTVCLVDDPRMQRLNRRYLGRNRPTDVIAFTISKRPVTADIAVSVATAASNAKIFKTTFLHELLLYAVHGVLHILGYDDDTGRKRSTMQKKAERILTSLGAKNHAHP